MSKRKIVLKLTTQKDLIHVESDARTFGELKKQLKDVMWDGMRVVERTTKNTLQMDDAVLPATDFVLFLVPEKVKSGADIDIDSSTYNDLRSHMSMLNKTENAGLSLDGKTENLRNTLREYYEKKKSCANSKEDLIALIEECKEKINSAIDELIKIAKREDEDYLFKTSMNDLEKEIATIKDCLKL